MTDYWIKLYTEILDDPKMGTMPDRLWRRTIECFLIAGKLNGINKTGMLPDTRQLAWILRIPTDDLESDLQQIALTGILERVVNGWQVVNFTKRQDAATPTERWRAHRDRKRHNEYQSNGTQTNSLTDTDTESDTESETDTETHTSVLTEAFVKSTNIIPHNLKKWNDADQTLTRAGITPEEIPITIKKMDDDKLQYSGLWSIVNTAIWVHSQRAAGRPIFDAPKSNGAMSKMDIADQTFAEIAARRARENGDR